jgi:hypothetical protein
MTPEALDGFRRVDGWKVGVDGSVALITVGVGGSIDTNRIASPIVGFIFDGKGLMYKFRGRKTPIRADTPALSLSLENLLFAAFNRSSSRG